MLDKLVTVFFVVIGLACAIFGAAIFVDAFSLFDGSGTFGGSDGVIPEGDEDAWGQLAIGLVLILFGLGIAAFPLLGHMLDTWEEERRRALEALHREQEAAAEQAALQREQEATSEQETADEEESTAEEAPPPAEPQPDQTPEEET